MLEGAPFSERDMRGPTVTRSSSRVTTCRCSCATRGGLSRHVHANHPFDVVGWDGCCTRGRCRSTTSSRSSARIHQPPPVHQTFDGARLRRLLVRAAAASTQHPDAVKIPYHHANVDSDEVLFYSDGDFMSRAGSGIGAGSISFHPPASCTDRSPGSLERSVDQERTDELAVMIDTFQPLGLTDAARSVSDPTYPWSWARRA